MKDLPSEPHQFKMLIDGKWVESSEKKRYSRKSPAHDIEVGEYPLGTTSDVDKAVGAARNAFTNNSWGQFSGAERSKLLLKVAKRIRSKKERLAHFDVLESGKPLTQSIGEVETAAELWEYAASLCRHYYGDIYNNLGEDMIGMITKEPIGVVGMITPWNFPFLIICQKLPFALATGCTVLIKPSELTPGSTLELGKIIEESGIPEGVVNIVTGYGDPVGVHMANHNDIDMISFTGSTEVGKKIKVASQSNLKKVSLELGGKNPQVVFPDANLEEATDAIVFGSYFNMGECCNSGSRLLVHAEIAEELTERIVKESKKVQVGDPFDPETKIGAIVDENQCDKIMKYIELGEKQGARLRLGGEIIDTDSGTYIEPTVFSEVEPDMDIAKNEIFGPVLSILTFKSIEEAIKIANDTLYGLSASIWTHDIDTAFTMAKNVRAGTLWINTFMDGYPELSFGGYNESGLGRELGRYALDEFTELKTIQLHLGPRNNWWT